MRGIEREEERERQGEKKGKEAREIIERKGRRETRSMCTGRGIGRLKFNRAFSKYASLSLAAMQNVPCLNGL